MKIKKYLSIGVILFFVMNIVIANEAMTSSITQDESSEQINSNSEQASEEINTESQTQNIEQKVNPEDNEINPKTTSQENDVTPPTKITSEEITENPEEVATDTENGDINLEIVSNAINEKQENASKEEVENTTEIQEISSKTNQSSEIKIGSNDSSKIKEINSPSKTVENFSEENNSEIENLSLKENQGYYINIDNVENSKSSPLSNIAKTQEKDENNFENKTQLLALYNNDGKIAIKGEIPANFTNAITKKEKIIDSKNFSKEFTIKSSEHLNSELIVYSDIPESKKENIKVYWKNEDKEVKIKEYLDENNNELIERISWIVPHLSEQVFEIRIETEILGNSTSGEIELNVINSPNINAKNPINFKFSIDYNGNKTLNCSLRLYNSTDSLTYSFSNEKPISEELEIPNGDYNWTATCLEEEDSSNKDSKSGNFTINEEPLTIYGMQEIYLTNDDIDFSLTGGYDLSNITLFYEDDSNIAYQKNNTSEKNIPSSAIQNPGKYILKIKSTGNEKPTQITTKEFSVASAEINLEKEKIEIDEDAKITIKINSPDEKILFAKLEYGDENYDYIAENQSNFIDTFTYSYLEEKIYNLKLTIYFDSQQFSITKQITVSDSDNTDNEKPKITLIEPANNAKFTDQTINFKYNATDNTKLKNCTYDLNYYSCPSCWGSVDYSENKSFSSNAGEATIHLHDFDVGNYTWVVTCYDNSSNSEWESRKFEIIPSGFEALTYSEETEVEEAQSRLEDFLTKIDSQGPEVKEALKDLGVYNDLSKVYSGRIQAIKIYFQTGYKTISPDKREEKNKEYLEELEEIKEKIPLDIEIIKANEYVKNSVSENLKEIIKQAILSTTPLIEKRSLNKLTENIFTIQNKFTASVTSKKLKIKYQNETREITLITKKIKTDEEDATFFEYTPKEFGKIIFITKTKELENNIFEINKENIEDNKIIYYIDDFVDIDEVKKTETILVLEVSEKNKNNITGFSIIDLKPNNMFNYLIYIVFLIVLLYSAIKIKEKIDWKKLSKKEEISKSLEFIKEAKEALKQNRLEAAKYSYYKIKEIYSKLSEKCKIKMQKEIIKIKIGIDKREIINLVKEYENLRRENQISEAKIIYSKIQRTYKTLPKKYQEKIYRRICPASVDDFFK
ncbi:MAG: hypothetical protein PVJ67_03150 [Candidatus Pacearchaeota archaeon]|jgi:hypothetical protein